MRNFFEYTSYRDPLDPNRDVKVTAIPHQDPWKDINLIGAITPDEMYTGVCFNRARKPGYVEPLCTEDMAIAGTLHIVAVYREIAQMRAYRESGYDSEMRGVECKVSFAMILKIDKMLNGDVEAVVNALVQTMV